MRTILHTQISVSGAPEILQNTDLDGNPIYRLAWADGIHVIVDEESAHELLVRLSGALMPGSIPSDSTVR